METKNPAFHLDRYHVTKLYVDWSFPPGEKQISVAGIQCAFDYDVKGHKGDNRRRMMRMSVDFQEIDANQQKVAHHVVCEIVGAFLLTQDPSTGKEEHFFRLNAVSVLYGALRGIIATTTGLFPGGKFDIPIVMANEIVADVERRRAEKARQQELLTTTTN